MRNDLPIKTQSKLSQASAYIRDLRFEVTEEFIDEWLRKVENYELDQMNEDELIFTNRMIRFGWVNTLLVWHDDLRLSQSIEKLYGDSDET